MEATKDSRPTLKTDQLEKLSNGRRELQVGRKIELTQEQVFGGLVIEGNLIELQDNKAEDSSNQILQITNPRPLLVPTGQDGGALAVNMSQDHYYLTREGFSTHRVWGGMAMPGVEDPHELHGMRFDVEGSRLAVQLDENSWVEFLQGEDNKVTVEVHLLNNQPELKNLEEVPAKVFETFGLNKIGTPDNKIYGAEQNGLKEIIHFEQKANGDLKILTIREDNTVTLKTKDAFSEKVTYYVAVNRDGTTVILINGKAPSSGHEQEALDKINSELNGTLQNIIDHKGLENMNKKMLTDIDPVDFLNIPQNKLNILQPSGD